MKRPLYEYAILPALVVLPASLSACHKGSSGSGSGNTSTSGSTSGVTASSTSDQPSSANDSEGGSAAEPHGHKDRAHASGDGGDEEPMGQMGKLVINKPTPEPMAPPALRRPSRTPALPNFPERSKYPKAAEIPKGGDTEGCGEVWSGTEHVPVECVDPSLHDKHPRAAKVVVPYEKMKEPMEKLPKMVDHHFDGTEGPVRKQGGPQCTAFAFTTALDHAYAKWTGKPAELSVMQIWARYHRLEEKAAVDENVGDFVANESDWPYDAKVANSWDKCHKKGGECGKPADEARLKELDKHKVAEITKVEIIPATKLEILREKLAGGADVTIGLRLPSFALAGEPGAKYIVGSQKGAAKIGHETVLAGYAMTPHGTYYLIHNSWGNKWGDEGYAWIHEDLLKEYWLDSRIVIPDVQPMEVAELRHHAHNGLMAKCEKDKAPDSISGMCAGKCPDGSPRHNNICADEKKKECPEGQINLSGECVLSAPKESGTEGKVRWECAPGGCTYEMPKGEAECKEEECQVSCPAPDFRLATTKRGLACVE
jgi:hypothetical protein